MDDREQEGYLRGVQNDQNVIENEQVVHEQEVSHEQLDHELHHQQEQMEQQEEQDVHQEDHQEEHQGNHHQIVEEHEQQQYQIEVEEEPVKRKPRRLTIKQQRSITEENLRLKYNNLILSRQVQVTKARLHCALVALKCVKQGKAYKKSYELALDERKCIKEVIGDKLHKEEPILGHRTGQQNSNVSVNAKTVETKRGERQRPSRYNRKSKDELVVIGAAADCVVKLTATLREAKEALRDLGIYNFEICLSNKLYNHPEKAKYLEERKRQRQEAQSEEDMLKEDDKHRKGLDMSGSRLKQARIDHGEEGVVTMEQHQMMQHEEQTGQYQYVSNPQQYQQYTQGQLQQLNSQMIEAQQEQMALQQQQLQRLSQPPSIL